MRVIFMGTPKAAVPTLEKVLADGHEVCAVWTQPDKPVGRGGKIAFSAVKEFALENNLPVFQPEKMKTAETAELFKSHEAEIAVVVAYGRILPAAILRTPPKGCVNVHFSLLPKYRGAAPVNFAIVRGETKTGVTTMKMDEGLDTGDILLMEETDILPAENAVDLMTRLSFIGANLLSKTLAEFDKITPKAQNNKFASYAPLMRKEDGLINWEMSAVEINNRVRGFQPFPTSFTFWRGKKLTIWKSFPADAQTDGHLDAASGEILFANKGELLVKCGQKSVLRIEELQLEGKRRMHVRDFLNGVKIQAGEILGTPKVL